MREQSFTHEEMLALSRLRAGFLDGTNAGGGYWQNETDLALYDATFAERIGWKWDAVLAELSARGWKPRARHVYDFGCGSGVAGRRVLGALENIESLALADVSPMAVRFAEAKVRAQFPQVQLRSASETMQPGSLLLVSHVLNELNAAARARLIALARQADEIIWVEAGTHADSRSLIAVREELRGAFVVVAPCTHAEKCGMLTPGNERHWCHHFGHVPSEASQDAHWSQFSRDLGIDLTTLPYSFLVLSRNGGGLAPGATRIIGRPREAKGRMEILACDAGGVNELTLQKRDEPAFFKSLKKGTAPSVQRWNVDAGKIRVPNHE